MRKLILVVAVFAIIVSSCSVSKAARGQRNLLSGSWTLDNISYQNNTGNFQSTLFNDAKDICFEGSGWFFRDNNSTGRYTINQSTLCTGGDRFIRWSVVDGSPNQLQFKFIDDKLKDIAGGTGYKLNISELTEQSMILRSNVSVEDERITVVYEFTKR
jgi:hypothetical protein